MSQDITSSYDMPKYIRHNVSYRINEANRCQTISDCTGLEPPFCLQRVIDHLKVRYMKKPQTIYTWLGSMLVSINPYRKDRTLYTNAMKHKYLNNLEAVWESPHIYGLAELCYNNMVETNQHYSIMSMGECGSGKTECSRHILLYLTYVSSLLNIPKELGQELDLGLLDDHTNIMPQTNYGSNAHSVERNLINALTILEIFGNKENQQNQNASYLMFTISLFYSVEAITKKKATARQITHAGVQPHFLFKSCLTPNGDNMPDFHIFSMLQENTRISSDDQYIPYFLNISVVESALTELDFSFAEQQDIWKTIKAIIILKEMTFEQSSENENSLVIQSEDNGLFSVCNLLQLCHLVNAPTMLSSALTQMTVCETVKDLSINQANRNKAAALKLLYMQTCDFIINKINKKLGNTSISNQQDHSDALSINIVDIPGHQNFVVNGYDEFCINYINEHLYALWISTTVSENNKHLYDDEGLHYDTPLLTDQPIFEYQMFNTMHYSFTDTVINNKSQLSSNDNPLLGLFEILKDITYAPGKQNDDERDLWFIQELVQIKQKLNHKKEIVPYFTTLNFPIQHVFGSIEYTISGFVANNHNDLTSDCLKLFNSRRTLCSPIETFMTQPNSANPTISLFCNNISIRQKEITCGLQLMKSFKSFLKDIKTTSILFTYCLHPNRTGVQYNAEHDKLLHQFQAIRLQSLLRTYQLRFPCHMSIDTVVTSEFGKKILSFLNNKFQSQWIVLFAFDIIGATRHDYLLGVKQFFLKHVHHMKLTKLLNNSIISLDFYQKKWKLFLIKRIKNCVNAVMCVNYIYNHIIILRSIRYIQRQWRYNMTLKYSTQSTTIIQKLQQRTRNYLNIRHLIYLIQKIIKKKMTQIILCAFDMMAVQKKKYSSGTTTSLPYDFIPQSTLYQLCRGKHYNSSLRSVHSPLPDNVLLDPHTHYLLPPTLTPSNNSQTHSTSEPSNKTTIQTHPYFIKNKCTRQESSVKHVPKLMNSSHTHHPDSNKSRQHDVHQQHHDVPESKSVHDDNSCLSSQRTSQRPSVTKKVSLKYSHYVTFIEANLFKKHHVIQTREAIRQSIQKRHEIKHLELEHKQLTPAECKQKFFEDNSFIKKSVQRRLLSQAYHTNVQSTNRNKWWTLPHFGIRLQKTSI